VSILVLTVYTHILTEQVRPCMLSCIALTNKGLLCSDHELESSMKCAYIKPVSTHGIDISVFVRIQKSYSLRLKVNVGDVWILSSTPGLPRTALHIHVRITSIFFEIFSSVQNGCLSLSIARLREDALTSLFTSVRSGCSFLLPISEIQGGFV